MNNPLDFTPREQFLISYYRDRKLSGGSRQRAYQVITILAPLACLGLYLNSNDAAWMFVAFCLLLYRNFQALWSSLTYEGSFVSILNKYEARLKELEANAKDTP